MLARKAAKTYGFNDPVETLNRIRKFSRPSETAEPIELLRAGFAFHARGLSNTKAIQNNLDWIWPFWIQKQYDPTDDSFIPRAFSFSHINLTQRNWTAVGIPHSHHYSIVDPRGLVTPFHDSWSVDFWVIGNDEKKLFPSKVPSASQVMLTGDPLSVETNIEHNAMAVTSRVRMEADGADKQELVIELSARSADTARLAVALRPYNPEGIQFIDKIQAADDGKSVTVNDEHHLYFSKAASKFSFSNYAQGDVANTTSATTEAGYQTCEAGMATAIALFDFDKIGTLVIKVPISPVNDKPSTENRSTSLWSETLDGCAKLDIPDQAEQTQFEQSLQTLSLLSPNDIYPGPYTYKRFWFRDACLIAHALLRTGQIETCRRALERFPERQTNDGFFLSQQGEWDSNGQVLWIYNLYEKLSGKKLPESCFESIKPALKWISNKVVQDESELHHGLLPAGFSAEHFGPNDVYYWDSFWAVGGLKASAQILSRHDENEASKVASKQADTLLSHIERTLENLGSEGVRGRLPTSPYRRMDSAAIGSLVVDYPLRLWPTDDTRVERTAEYLYENCVIGGAFFQDMIHSGFNVYLTLDLAQTFLRKGDPRWHSLVRSCLKLSSPTGQWPEAIHPRTFGGCMGDGQHAWAAAEWVLLAIARLVREEDDRLVIGSGIVEEWIHSGVEFSISDVPTSFGRVSISFTPQSQGQVLSANLTIINPSSDSIYIAYKVPGYLEQSGINLEKAELQADHQP